MDEQSFDWLRFFPAEQWDVFPIMILGVLALTQFFKVTSALIWRRPCDTSIHVLSAGSSGLAAFAFWSPPAGSLFLQATAAKVVVAAIVWLGSVSIATYGLRVLRVFAPRLHNALNYNRRRNESHHHHHRRKDDDRNRS